MTVTTELLDQDLRALPAAARRCAARPGREDPSGSGRGGVPRGRAPRAESGGGGADHRSASGVLLPARHECVRHRSSVLCAQDPHRPGPRVGHAAPAGRPSGCPARAESVHDHVENSHASTALSYADGLAVARQLRGDRDGRVVAVVGDGALTGGMCWEALNNAGTSRTAPRSRPRWSGPSVASRRSSGRFLLFLLFGLLSLLCLPLGEQLLCGLGLLAGGAAGRRAPVPGRTARRVLELRAQR